MFHDDVENAVIARVYEGMTVVDAAGEKLGTVGYVQMGDREAVTTAGESFVGSNLLADVASTISPDGHGEPHVPDPLRSELIRVGYVKIGGTGLFSHGQYVRSDQLASVEGDTVHLTIRKDELAQQGDEAA